MAGIKDELLDELLKDYAAPEDLLGKNGIIAQLKKRLIERAMEAERTSILATKSMKPKATAAETPAMAAPQRALSPTIPR